MSFDLGVLAQNKENLADKMRAMLDIPGKTMHPLEN
jgi:hypothetical protein